MNSRLAQILAFLAACTFLSSKANADEWLHTVRPGDSFWSICAELTEQANCWRELPSINTTLGKPRKLAVGSQVKIPVDWLKVPPVPAEVEYVRGRAFVERISRTTKRMMPGSSLQANQNYLQPSSAEKTLEPLKAGSMLQMGDKIVTQEGNVLLRFADGSTFLLRANGELILEKLSAHGETGMVDTHLRLNRGTGRAKVKTKAGKSRYKVSTPAAIAAARGTDFSISAGSNGKLTINEVLEGSVSLKAAGESQSLNQGYGSIAELGKAPTPPRQLLPAPKLLLANRTDSPFTLIWEEVSNAKRYTIDVYLGTGTSNLFESHTVSATNTPPELGFQNLQDGTYTFVARATDDLGLRGLEASATTVTSEKLNAPEFTVKDISVDGQQIKLNWQAVKYAQGYIVEVSETSSFENILQKIEPNTNMASFKAPNTDTYYTRIRSVYPGNKISEPSTAHAFSTITRDLWLQILQSVAILAIILA